MAGFPAHDPTREVVLWGRVRAADAPVIAKSSRRGTWTEDAGRLLPVPRKAQPDGYAEPLWFPHGDPAHLGEGLVRARVELQGSVDVSLLVRTRYQTEKTTTGTSTTPELVSGYGATIEGDVLRLHRWDRGMVLPLGPEAKLPLGRTPRPTSLELVVLLVGPQLVAQVYDGDTLELLATAAAHDTTYAHGCVGFRVGPKHDPRAAFTLLSAMDSSKHASLRHRRNPGPLYGVQAPSDRTPFGNTRYAWIAADAVAGLPKALRGKVQGTMDRGGRSQSLLFLDTVGYERLARAVEVIAVDSNAPWSAFDAAFRARAAKPAAARGRGFVLDDSYKDPALVEQLLTAYHERHPELTTLEEIGRTHQGRPILALKISDDDGGKGEPAVLMNAAHHGSELLSIEYALDAIDTLLVDYARDPKVKRWVDRLEIWCVPLVNVDGNHMFVHESRFAIRKNAFDGDGDGFADPFEGVDLNRNYPFGWGEGTGSSSAPMHKWYRGRTPGSEPETKAMMALGLRERFAAVLSFHTFGTDVYSSYVVDTRKDTKPDVSRGIGQQIAEAAPEQPNARRYAVRKGPYPVAGSDQDWYLHATGAIAFVVEGSHHNPDLAVRNEAVAATRPLWQALLDRVVDGPWIGGHVRDESGRPIDAVVMVDEIATFEGERWTTRTRDGRFDRAVAKPGRYTLVVTVDGRSPVRHEVTVGKTRKDVDIVVPAPGSAG